MGIGPHTCLVRCGAKLQDVEPHTGDGTGRSSPAGLCIYNAVFLCSCSVRSTVPCLPALGTYLYKKKRAHLTEECLRNTERLGHCSCWGTKGHTTRGSARGPGRSGTAWGKTGRQGRASDKLQGPSGSLWFFIRRPFQPRHGRFSVHPATLPSPFAAVRKESRKQAHYKSSKHTDHATFR